MKAEVTSEWLVLTAETQADLNAAFQLAIDLRGQPHSQMWNEAQRAGILVGDVSEEAKQHTIPFPFGIDPDAADLSSYLWRTIEPDGAIEIKIPRYPVIGADVFSAFMLMGNVVCIIAVRNEFAVATG